MKANVFLRVFIAAIILVSALQSTASAQAPDPERPIPPQANEADFISPLAGGVYVTGQDKGITPTLMAKRLVGEGISVTNATFIGAKKSAGVFTADSGIFDFNKGVVLSSGSVYTLPGPNNSASTSTYNGTNGDPQLTALSGYTTYDASILEFDFYPTDNFVSFQFVFTSEEYNEYVNTRFNDVFGFFINGANCAVVQGSPITINTINYGNPYGSSPNKNRDLFINNDGTAIIKKNISMDGLTKTLTCSSSVNANQKNHMKLAIADSSDGVYDAAVFIKAGSVTVERRPVILVPGILASFNKSCLFLNSNCEPDDSGWGWTPVKAEPVYHNLIKRLNDVDYTEENHYLSIFYYDWRKPVSFNGEELMNRISQIKELTGAKKVDIIAHSMGGLVSRAYIQSRSYNNDVAHLVTLGTPHKGSTDAYVMWEGATTMPKATGITGKFEEGLQSGLMVTLLNYYRLAFGYKETLDALQGMVPSVRDLLPTRDFIIMEATGEVIPAGSMTHQNIYLNSINSTISSLFQRTDMVALYGINHDTAWGFYVSPREESDAPKWDDGKPNFEMIPWVDGDGTVLKESANLSGALTEDFSLEHGELPGSDEVINYIFSELDISIASASEIPVIPNYMMIYAYGNVNVTMQNPNGSYVSTIEQAQESNTTQPMGSTDMSSIHLYIVENPTSGKYSMQITGDGYKSYSVGVVRSDAVSEGGHSLDELVDEASSRTTLTSVDTFQIQYGGTSGMDLHIEAPKPILKAPLQLNEVTVTVKTVANAIVQIIDQTSGQTLAQGNADANGNLTLGVPPLVVDHLIYAIANSIQSDPVPVEDYNIYIPLMGE